MKKIVLLTLVTLFMVFAAGCKLTVEDKKYSYTFQNKSIYSIVVSPAKQSWNAFTVAANSSKTIEITDSTIQFTYVVSGTENQDDVSYTALNGKLVFNNSNLIRVTNRVDINKDGSASGKNFSIHLITWGMPDEKGNGTWFIPDTEYCKFYTLNNGMVPTLKVGNQDTENVANDESGKYLYYVLAGTTDFAYFRTTTKIQVGPSAGRAKSFTIYNDSDFSKTDKNGNDLAQQAVPKIILVETTTDGKRSVERIIPVERIK